MLNIIKVNIFEVIENLAHSQIMTAFLKIYTPLPYMQFYLQRFECKTLFSMKKERRIRPCTEVVFYSINSFYVFMPYHIFIYLACPVQLYFQLLQYSHTCQDSLLCLEISLFFSEQEKKRCKLKTTFDSIQNSSIYQGFISCHFKLYISG